MEGERIVFTHEIEPSHAVRVLATGEVDSSVLDALSAYVSRQREKFAVANMNALINAGFSQLPNHKLWVSRERRIAFSYDFARERDPAWINHHINEQVDETNFVFYFVNVHENIHVCQDILSEIGLSKLRAQVHITQGIAG